jgi:hypothetical protein
LLGGRIGLILMLGRGLRTGAAIGVSRPQDGPMDRVADLIYSFKSPGTL